MKQTVFRRILALVLSLSFVIGGGAAVSAGATGVNEDSSLSNTSLADVKELLNAISYKEYTDSELFQLSLAAKESVVIDATDYNKDATTAKVKLVAVDQATGKATVVPNDYVAKEGEILCIFSPESGEVAFNATIPETAKYSIAIEYFPATSIVDAEGKEIYADKTGSIERILKVDGKIPFAEARYVVMSKIWKNVYTIKMSIVGDPNAAVKEYEDCTPYIEKAEKCGIKYTVAADRSSITLELPDGGWTSEIVNKLSEEDMRFFTTDIDNNEIRCTMQRIPEFRTYEVRDVDGFYADSFEFVLEEGERVVSLEAKSQGMLIKSITLFPQAEDTDYEAIAEGYANQQKGQDSVKIEAEFPYASSSQTIYPVEDTSSAANSPSATDRTVLNTIGGEKWQTSGQWIRYAFQVNSSGLYQIVTRYRQNINDGIFSSRVLYLYSDSSVAEGEPGYYNGLPFDQAANLRFEYSTGWQVQPLKYAKKVQNAEGVTEWQDVYLEFYFEAGVTYTMEFNVSLGDLGGIVSDVSTSLTNINNYYLNILKLTGADPDEYRDYGFNRVMPDTMQGLIIESRRLYAIAEELKIIAGAKSSNVATLEKIAWLLNEMGRDEDNVAKYLEQLKTYIGTLGTWINDNKTQPLQLDYLVVQSADAELPVAEANFFQSMGHEIMKFFMSFFRNYDRMGATTNVDGGNASVEVWLAKGRDQTQVIRNLVNNDFTPQYGHLVNLKLVASATLLPSILSGSGPDVYIGVSEGNIINYAIRGALTNIENFEGFYDITSQYKVEHKLISDFIHELKADNYIIEGEGTSTVKAMTADGIAMYTITFNADGSGSTEKYNLDDPSKPIKNYNGFTKEGWLYQVGSTFEGVTYTYKDVLDENGNRVKNEKAQFNEAAMYTLGLPDADNIMHYYGLPEEQNFNMMFVRNDILAALGIEIPKSWDDIESTIATLQANNMEIGMSNDYKIFLYQSDSQLFADDGMRINLDSNVALNSFEYMCSLFTDYSFPYKYDFANRFRTGEMPIGIASYNATYNQLVVFATEIRGLWSFYPLPGIATYKTNDDGSYMLDDFGDRIVESVNNVAVASVSAISMINGCENQEAAWDFMKWHVGAECQVNYSDEMVAILGDSAKYATANITALESMPWTSAEYEQLAAQFNNLASIPNYPGSYIIGRYTQFAFLDAYDDQVNPVDALNKHINTINKEITRKREEFDLETLEIGQTLAGKRIDQAIAAIKALDDAAKTKYAAEIALFNQVIDSLETTKTYVSDEKIAELLAVADVLRATQYSRMYPIAEYIEEAARALKQYQASYVDG